MPEKTSTPEPEKTNTPEPEKPKKLTPSDPIAKEVVEKFAELEDARINIGLQLLSLEQNRVKLLAAAHMAEDQKKRLFEQVLVERGLPVTTRAEIDSKTGVLSVLEPGETPGKPPA
jgi:hypothetical protein